MRVGTFNGFFIVGLLRTFSMSPEGHQIFLQCACHHFFFYQEGETLEKKTIKMFCFTKRANIGLDPRWIESTLFHLVHLTALRIKSDLDNIQATHYLMGRLISLLCSCDVTA